MSNGLFEKYGRHSKRNRFFENILFGILEKILYYDAKMTSKYDVI